MFLKITADHNIYRYILVKLQSLNGITVLYNLSVFSERNFIWRFSGMNLKEPRPPKKNPKRCDLSSFILDNRLMRRGEVGVCVWGGGSLVGNGLLEVINSFSLGSGTFVPA